MMPYLCCATVTNVKHATLESWSLFDAHPINYVCICARGSSMDLLLLYWPTWVQVVFIVAIFSGFSILGLYIVRVTVPLERLKQNHEVAGFTFGVIGAFYGLLLAFVIVAAWERFDRADEKVQGEAMSLDALYRLSKGFPQPTQHNMQKAIRAYAEHAIDIEWPAMASSAHGRPDNPTGSLGMWAILGSYSPLDSRQTLLVDKSYDQLQIVGEDRALRYLYSGEDFPSVVWLVIYAGLFITIGFSYFFGLDTFPSQALMCGIFSSLLGLTILAILELAHPYQGSVVVSDVPFKFAISRMNLMDTVALYGPDDQSQFAAEPAASPSP
ncbi:MAG TPA: DUF4239 domain-containing protein [Candidatus Binataceae bacterium]|nr:DUF4239 domain-containing protein [Candidatus Binataceae bacterium]